MKKIPMPLVDDIASTTLTANSASLFKTSYPHLRNALPEVLDSYQAYIGSNGDALRITPIAVSAELKSGLHKNYNSPPQFLPHIKQIREASPRVCPMCGSPKTMSLDHLLPKEVYPEFSIFSKNLVPACDCNTKRRTNTVDHLTQGRVLHPYFDSCLQYRQLTSTIMPGATFPSAVIEVVCINPADPMIAAIRFHLKNVVLPSGLIRWLDSQWESLTEYPAGIIHTFPRGFINSPNELLGYLNDALQRYDHGYGTPNNWDSIFIHGLIQSAGIQSWLLQLHNKHYP
jgi:hypothetical protein